jgi:glycosyltransferase involved in cell wall biosynthesis
MRIAWFSPMPPVRTGVAACSAELVGALRAEHAIDVYADRFATGAVMSAHDFIWRHRRQPYDLTVYQLGNSSHHDYQWPYLFRYPGLAVLHDAHLHHARAAALLRTRRPSDYRAEFAASHPGASPDLAELAVAGFDNHLYYEWPMRRLVVAASRMTAVHTPALAAQLREELPGAPVAAIRLGHGTPVSEDAARDARGRVRASLGLPAGAVVFGVFGGLTPEKRLPQILEAFRALLPYCPGAHLLLAGAGAAHYDLRADLQARGLAVREGPQDDEDRRVTITGYIESDDALTAAIAAADVAINMRWPTAREMSGPWLRALAAGVPTITLDLAHLVHVPSLDPRTWLRSGGAGPEAVTVAIDILDEDHSLQLAMRRLSSDAALRRALAAAGREYWAREHSLDRMLDDYRRLLPAAAAARAPHPALPAHLLNSGNRVLRAILRDFGQTGGRLGGIAGAME